MSNNITTVPMLPDAEGVGTEDTLYLIQGTGSDRDRKATLSDVFDGVLPHKIDNAYDYGDVTFGYEESRGGKILTGNIRDKQVTADKLADGSVNGWKLDETSAFTGKTFYGTESVGAPSVNATTEIKTPTIEGTTAGTSSNYLLVNSAMTVNGDADLKSNVSLGSSLMTVSQDDQKVTVNGDAEVSGTLTTRAVTASGKVAINSAASVSGQLDVSGPANLKGGANVADLKITGSVQFPSGNGLIPTLVYNVDNSRGDILSNYVGTDRNVFILLVNADSAVHTIQYTSQEASGASERYKQIAVAEAGLFYIDSSGNAAPVS
jgi:cytoskeletal protein CcmA (bactofilin family)